MICLKLRKSWSHSMLNPSFQFELTSFSFILTCSLSNGPNYQWSTTKHIVVFFHSLLLLSSSFTLDSNNIIHNEKFHAKNLQDFNNAPFWRHKMSNLRSDYVNLVAPKKANAPTIGWSKCDYPLRHFDPWKYVSLAPTQAMKLLQSGLLIIDQNLKKIGHGKSCFFPCPFFQQFFVCLEHV